MGIKIVGYQRCRKHGFKGADWEVKFHVEETKSSSKKNLLDIQYSFG